MIHHSQVKINQKIDIQLYTFSCKSFLTYVLDAQKNILIETGFFWVPKTYVLFEKSELFLFGYALLFKGLIIL